MIAIIECKQKGGSLGCGGFHKCGETIGFEIEAPRGMVSTLFRSHIFICK
jgi:hypothetical protein